MVRGSFGMFYSKVKKEEGGGGVEQGEDWKSARS